MRFFRRLFFALAFVIIVWILCTVFLCSAQKTLDQAYCAIPHAVSQGEVQRLLAKFKEEPASISCIPDAYRGGLPEDARVFRYVYILPFFSFYVLYDNEARVVLKIPTYE